MLRDMAIAVRRTEVTNRGALPPASRGKVWSTGFRNAGMSTYLWTVANKTARTVPWEGGALYPGSARNGGVGQLHSGL